MSPLLNKPAKAPNAWAWSRDALGREMRGRLLRYGFAVLAVAAAAGLRHVLGGIFGSDLAYITFYTAITLVAVVAGFGPGLLATLLAAAYADYFFLEPYRQFGFGNAANALGITVFSATGLSISALAGAMRRMRERYVQAETAVLESITDAFFSLDREGRFTYVNAAMERTLGCRREDLLGRGIGNGFPDGAGSPFRQVLEKVMDKGVAVHDEIQYPPTRTWYELHAYPSVTGLSVYFRDIGGRKRAERQLEENCARLASIVELAMDAIITIDAERRIVLFNPAAERMFGCPAAEAIGGSMERFIPERFREAHRQHLRRYGETGASSRAMGTPGSLSALRANGEEFPVEASISRVEVGGRRFFTVTLRDITERQRVEAALRESEGRFRAMADSVPVLIWISGPDKACTWVNQQWCHFTGRRLEQELGYGWAEGVHRDDLERCLAIYIESFDRRAPFEMEYRLRRADGEYRWIVDQGVPRFGPDGTFLGYIGSATDITERKRAADALRISEERERRRVEELEVLMETVPAVVFIARDPDCRTITGNRAAHEILRMPSEANFSKSAPADGQPSHFKVFKNGVELQAEELPMQLAARGIEVRDFEEEIRFDDGTSVYLFGHAVPLWDSEGRARGAVSAFVDITERKRAEARIQESEAFIRRILDNILAFVGVLLPDGTVVQVNNAPLAGAGISFEEVYGKKVWDCYWCSYSPDVQQRFRTAVEQAARGEVIRFDVEIHMAGDESIIIDFMLAPLRDDKGRITHLISSAIPITERKEMEQALREADRHKDEFLAMLAHELRNPLAPIRNAVQVMRRIDLPDPKLCWISEVIDRQVHHLARLVDDLLDVSRLVRGKILLRKEPLELAGLVHQAVETSRPLIEARKHRLALSLPPESVCLEGDPVRLTQVLLNLLNNAAKYTHEGGRIWLEAERAGCDEVVIRVRDTGMGIPAPLLPRIFDLFTQAEQSLDRAQGGLGIGLTLVQRLVALHGGHVEARSEGPGRGAEFSVWLPVRVEPASAETPDSVSRTAIPARDRPRAQ